MSRVGRQAIKIPSGVKVTLSESVLSAEKGTINETYIIPDCITAKIEKDIILFSPTTKNKRTSILWGTTQRNVRNLIYGLVDDFKITLKLSGVGYKSLLRGKQLVLQLGFSHEIQYDIPDGIVILCPDPTTVIISGRSRKQVGDVAAFLRKYRKPEPYKGKGIIRVGEFVYRKDGKKK